MEIMSNIEHGLWAKYELGNEKLFGLVEDAGDGLYWFNTLGRMEKNKRDLLVGEDDITLLGIELCETDVNTLIELALQTNDQEWFEEITLNIY